ncbi:MAG: hypothetical protein GX998_09685 [Firmicutes bacterium]|nr:hypothetical protein [Bacillota bacterium]
MHERITVAAYVLPEPQRRCRAVAEALGDCRTVFWLFPRYISPNRAIAAVIEMCSQSLSHRTVSIEEDHLLPGKCLNERLGLGLQESLEADLTAEETLEQLRLQEIDLLVIKGIDLLAKDALELWVAFVGEWAAAAKTQQAKGYFPASILIAAQNPELCRLVSEDVNLALYWYWGWLGELEMQLLARNYMYETGPLGTDGNLLWLECSAIGLAGFDADLLYWLLHNGEGARDINDLARLLKTYAEEKRLWSSENIRVLQEGSNWDEQWQHGMVWSRPPQNQVDLWSNGILDWQSRQGLVIHSAAVALTGNSLELQHRIWREHARVLLPLLDRMRLDVCRYLDRSFLDWNGYCTSLPDYSEQGDAATDAREPVAEFTSIIEFLNGRVHYYPVWRTFRDIIYNVRDVRNSLAHYTPLNKDQFTTILQQINQMHNLMGNGSLQT